MDRSNEFEEGQKRLLVRREDFIVHDDYNSNTLENNLALIKLSHDLVFNDYIQPAVLQNEGDLTNFRGQELFVSGWGHIHRMY